MTLLPATRACTDTMPALGALSDYNYDDYYYCYCYYYYYYYYYYYWE